MSSNDISPCQIICPYNHAVFVGFAYWINHILGKGQYRFEKEKNIIYRNVDFVICIIADNYRTFTP